MPKICYVPKRFGRESRKVIQRANDIIEEYRRQGYDLTLRQLYYQFVARGIIANKDTEYKRLGQIVNDARLNGDIDWLAIVDRTRNMRSLSHWDDESAILRSAADSYHLDWWKDQDYYIEVWIEKDALVGVIAGACNRYDVPYFSCRGYTSQSELWSAARRMRAKIDDDKQVVVIHLGDHDPSGIDMTRDIEDRLALFLGDGNVDDGMEQFAVQRIALNMDQVRQYDPPPNPAKITDSRCASYIRVHGHESWELDALDPAVLDGLVTSMILAHLNDDALEKIQAQEKASQERLRRAATEWNRVTAWLANGHE